MSNSLIMRGLEKLGYKALRPEQESPLQAILSGVDVLAILPTSMGKSLLYQLPAVTDDCGVTIVVSPLVALQRDQHAKLIDKGLTAWMLNSSLSSTEYRKVLAGLQSQKEPCILFLAPEQLLNKEAAPVLRSIQINRVVVDECHMIPAMAVGFRSAFSEIGGFIDSLPHRPQVLALTATATKEDQAVILNFLHVPSAERYNAPIRRANLELVIKEVSGKKDQAFEHKLTAIRHALSDLGNKQSAIIYAPTVEEVKQICKHLVSHDFAVEKYHGRMKHKKRCQTETAFLSGKVRIVVATSAFGLGIDKPDVRLVINAGLPLTIDDYVQQFGRAGRDGKKARCLLIYSSGDLKANEQTLSYNTAEAVAALHIRKLKALYRLLSHDKCLWEQLEKYYGQRRTGRCKKCSNCKGKN